MQTKIVYAIVASALLFPVTVVAKRGGHPGGPHQNIVQLIKDDETDKAQEKIIKMIERMTKNIENLQKAKDALGSEDTTPAQRILEEGRKGQKGHQKLVKLIKDGEKDKAQEKISKMIERMTKNIEKLETAKKALGDGDTTSAQSIIEEWHQEQKGHKAAPESAPVQEAQKVQ